MCTLAELLNKPVKIDGVKMIIEPLSIFVKGDGLIILTMKIDSVFKMGYKLYPVRDRYDGDYYNAVPIASFLFEGDWHPYEGGGICYDADIPAGPAWGNTDMDELDWFIFNNLK